ncbi:hypothetical protein [Azospirillum sp. sgz302134]
MREKQHLTLTVTWRDENYGGIYRAKAFRATVSPVVSDAILEKLARLFRRHGFAMNPRRGSWIAENCADQALHDLVRDLSDAGYLVLHKGCVPDTLAVAELTAA